MFSLNPSFIYSQDGAQQLPSLQTVQEKQKEWIQDLIQLEKQIKSAPNRAEKRRLQDLKKQVFRSAVQASMIFDRKTVTMPLEEIFTDRRPEIMHPTLHLLDESMQLYALAVGIGSALMPQIVPYIWPLLVISVPFSLRFAKKSLMRTGQYSLLKTPEGMYEERFYRSQLESIAVFYDSLREAKVKIPRFSKKEWKEIWGEVRARASASSCEAILAPSLGL